MWSEKTIVTRQRLAKDFGAVVERFSRLPESREQSDSDTRLWRGWISVKETSPESEWVITLSGDETTSRPVYAMLSGKSSRHVKSYRINILASRLVDDTIKLAVQENVEHWSKLEGLWKKLWAELERQGYKEAPALEVAFPVAEDQPTKTAFHPVPWDVAVLPCGLAEATDFFVHGWDFAVPPFASQDGRQLNLDNVVMVSTNIHKVYGHDPEGRTIVTFNAMTQNPDGKTWDLASTIPAIQFILEPLGVKTRVEVVLLERGAGLFLCAMLDRLISAYSQSERGIEHLIDFVVDYCGIGANRAGQNLPDYKRKALEARLNDLTAEYEAVSQQMSYTLNAADKLKLQRQLDSIAQEIGQVQDELGLSAAVAPSPPVPNAKAEPGSASQHDQLHGAGNRWAVLVGVNAYDDALYFGPLQVCVKDVEAIHAQLIAGGFDPTRIRLITDNRDEKPTRANILAALKSVADATEPDDLLLFYYSGHGDAAGGESYLVAREGRHLVLSDTAVPVARVKQIMDAAPARAKVILLDACHSGADIGKKGPKPMTKEFIERVFEQAEGMAILASCKQGQVSYEWRKQERSVFTHYLLNALQGEADRDEKGFVTVQDASRHVADGVKLWASQRNVSQTPTLQYSVAGDIILTRYVGTKEPQ